MAKLVIPEETWHNCERFVRGEISLSELATGKIRERCVKEDYVPKPSKPNVPYDPRNVKLVRGLSF